MRKKVLLALILFAAPLTAQTVRTWVATTGLDSNPCSKTSPCRNFVAAMNAVSPGGEIVVLDSGGYGAVTITQGVDIIAPAGVHAAVAPTSGRAFDILVSSTESVVLRRIVLNSFGADYGIHVNGNLRMLQVEHCLIDGFSIHGILFNAEGKLAVFDTVAQHNTTVAINVQSPVGTAVATVTRSQLSWNNYGIFAGSRSRVLVRDTAAAYNARGFFANADSDAAVIHVENCTAMGNGTGAGALSSGGISLVSVTDSMIVRGGTGARAEFGGIIRMSGTTISDNATGVSTDSSPASAVLSFTNNYLEGNDVDGAFSGTIGLQ